VQNMVARTLRQLHTLTLPISDLANAPGVTESPLTAKTRAYQ